MVLILQVPQSRIHRIRIAILSVLTSASDHVLFRQLLNRIIRLIRSLPADREAATISNEEVAAKCKSDELFQEFLAY